MALKIRRGTDAERTAGGGVVFAQGELVYVTDTNTLYIGNGTAPGGILVGSGDLGELISFVLADTQTDEVKLLRNLNLNGQDVVGTGNININGAITATGNINIGDNATEDTVTLTAKVDSDIVPTQDSTYNLGKVDKRWQHVYAAGLTIDGQIDAVAVNANIVADNTDVMVDVATNTLSGNLTGNVAGTVIGSLVGDVTGNVLGNLTGNVVGSVFSDNSTTLVDGVAGILRGDHYGSLYGSVKALDNGFTILNPGTDGTDASIVATVVGDVTGNVLGNLTGNVVGNTSGFHTGDVKGSVFADNSTVLIDAVAGVISGANITGTITANLIGNVQGNVTGNVVGDITGNVLTNLIDSVDSSAIIVTPILQVDADFIASQSILVGAGNFAGPGSANVIINNTGEIRGDSLVIANISVGDDPTAIVTFGSSVEFQQSVFFSEETLVGDVLLVNNFDTSNTSDRLFVVQTYTGPPGDDEAGDDPANYNKHVEVTPSKAQFGVPVKFAVIADDTARTTLIPAPEKGMVILMEAGTAPAAANQLQFYNGTSWVNV